MSNLELDPSIVFSGLSDPAWLDVILSSLRERRQRNVLLPGFATEEVQPNTVGSAGEHSLREGFHFYQVVKEYSAKLGRPIARDSKVLDFGCGWGRIIRLFLKDVAPNNLHGWDVDETMIAVCNRTFSYCRFEVIPFAPPVALPDGFFDCIYAYSVLSHLAEHVHLQWVQEFARILRPGGVLLATTQGRGFIDFCASLRGKPQESLWHRALAGSFVDREKALHDYDAGQFLHAANGGGPNCPATFYGESLIPKGYVQRAWTPYLSYRDFVDDPTLSPQALIVMQKPHRDESLSTSVKAEHAKKQYEKALFDKMTQLINALPSKIVKNSSKNSPWQQALNALIDRTRPVLRQLKPLVRGGMERKINHPAESAEHITFRDPGYRRRDRVSAPDYSDLVHAGNDSPSNYKT